jgi:hypothetical protein
MSLVKKATAAERPLPELELLDSWVLWREASADVRSAYRWWSECARPDRALAFAGYRAAVDREQHAASIHSDRAERLRAPSGP